MKKKVEEFIMRLYEKGKERTEIIRDLATENNLTYSEAESIVNATILRAKNMANK